MNSLTYLSRQFDVLASARTAPSTPTSSPPPKVPRRRSSHSSDQRAQTSPLKRAAKHSNFTPPIDSPTSSSTPKRSQSSPADLVSLATRPAPGHSPTEAAMKTRTRLLCYLRRIFSAQIFLSFWDSLRMVWVTVTAFRWRSGRMGVEVHEKFVGTQPEAPILVSIPKIPPDSTIESPHIFTFPHSAHPPSDPEKQSSPCSSPTLPSYPNIDLDTQTLHSSSNSSSSSLHITTSSRSPTPVLNARKPLFSSPKTLVLDLDETLIHSTSRPIYSSGSGGSGLLGLGSLKGSKAAGHTVEVILDGRSIVYHVYKRPFVDFFLRTVSGWYTVVIFTASLQEYADPVIDWLDAGRGIIARRLFRDSCTKLPNGSYTKDLSIVDPDLSRVCLVDNSPISYRINEVNGIPIEGWTHDPSDEALLELLPILDSLRFTSDVRRVLGIRGFS